MRLDPITVAPWRQGHGSVEFDRSPLGIGRDRRTIDSSGLAARPSGRVAVTVKPDDHSEVVPLLPIPNRTVKRLSADDSADSRVKVGHCQANIKMPDRKRSGICLSALIYVLS